MALGFTRIKDKDLVEIVAALKTAQQGRNNAEKRAESRDNDFKRTGKRSSDFPRLLERVNKEVNRSLLSSLEAAVDKLRRKIND